MTTRNISETMLMNPATGSVAPESEWRADYEDCKARAERTDESLSDLWGGPDFEDAGLVEVIQGEDGDWIEKEI